MTTDPNARGEHTEQPFTIDPEHPQQAGQQQGETQARRENHLDDAPPKPYGTGESGQGGFAPHAHEGPH